MVGKYLNRKARRELSRRVPRRRGHPGGEEHGFFGLSTLALVAVLAVILGFIVAEFPQIVSFIAGNLRADVLLVHVPVLGGGIDPTTDTSGTGDQLFDAAERTGGKVYGALRNVSFVLIAVAMMIIGVSLMLEQFHLLPEGTALQLIHESVFILILLFVFPTLYNLCASGVNALNEKVILHPVDGGNMVSYVVSEIGHFPDMGLSIFGKFIWTYVLFGFAMLTLFSVVLMGVIRYFLTLVLAAAFPLILAFRLTPFTRRAGEVLSSTLVGLLLATIVAAVLLRVAGDTLHAVGGSSFLRWALAAGAVSATALISTMLAGSIGGIVSGVGRELAGAVAAPIAGVAGGTIAAMGAGTAVAPLAAARGAAVLGRAGAEAAARSAFLTTLTTPGGILGRVGAGMGAVGAGVGKVAADMYAPRQIAATKGEVLRKAGDVKKYVGAADLVLRRKAGIWGLGVTEKGLWSRDELVEAYMSLKGIDSPGARSAFKTALETGQISVADVEKEMRGALMGAWLEKLIEARERGEEPDPAEMSYILESVGLTTPYDHRFSVRLREAKYPYRRPSPRRTDLVPVEPWRRYPQER